MRERKWTIRVYASHYAYTFSNPYNSHHDWFIIKKTVFRPISDLILLFPGVKKTWKLNFDQFLVHIKCYLFSLCLPECRWTIFKIEVREEHSHVYAFQGGFSIVFQQWYIEFSENQKIVSANILRLMSSMPPKMHIGSTIPS